MKGLKSKERHHLLLSKYELKVAAVVTSKIVKVLLVKRVSEKNYYFKF